LALSIAVPAARALETLEIDAAMIWIENADPDSAISPLLPGLGLSLPLLERRLWGLDVGFLLTGTYYEYAGGRAIPAELEQRDFAVPIILADARAGLHLPLGTKVKLGLTGGLLLALRIPIPLAQDAAADFGSALTYLLMRSLYPEAELFVQFPVLPSFDFRVAVRSAWPWFHLWDGEPYGFWDQLIVSGVLGVIYRLPAKTDQTKS
jgi:hypothetical protein